MPEYRVTAAGHMLEIAGKRRKKGQTVGLNATQAQFEELRGTVELIVADDKAKAKSGK